VEDAVNSIKRMEQKQHWENVFSTKQQNEVSWYQPVPQKSIDFFETQKISKTDAVIDIGCGDSYFVDYLANKNYENIHALDISENAIQRLKNRLGEKANSIHWHISNIIEFTPTCKYTYWHDRAVFHFLTKEEDIQKYLEIVNNNILPDGYMMIATFSKKGPIKCSGLNITQYDIEDLTALFSEYFSCIAAEYYEHPTPFNTTQHFTFCLFKKIK
jgi:cyclopropane fatty-acyl-phospholipid synthase-like methyltransferase